MLLDKKLSYIDNSISLRVSNTDQDFLQGNTLSGVQFTIQVMLIFCYYGHDSGNLAIILLQEEKGFVIKSCLSQDCINLDSKLGPKL